MIIPQAGFQTKFLSSPAQITIGGGSAGGGKTYGLLMEAIRFSDRKSYGGVIFRRTMPQIRNQGGLWDTSQELFRKMPEPPKALEVYLTWKFKSGGKLKFSHLQHENDKYSYQGSQIPFIGFDELTHFSEDQFFYMLSRNRSPQGVPAYIRATCNPDSNSWVKKFISWWIYPDDYHIESLQGMPIPERDSVVRYFIRDGKNYVWGGTRAEVIAKCPHIFLNKKFLSTLLEQKISPESMVKSATFVFGDIYGNKMLLKNDPNYLGNLMSQDSVEKSRLLTGSWKHIEDGNRLYQYTAIKDLFTNDFIGGGKKYITADIAFEGSDRFVVGVWDGWRLIHVVAIDKSDAKVVLDTIKDLARRFSVPNSQIAYDYDGLGSFLKGFLSGARPFVNGSKPLIDDNYFNLKTECYYKLAEFVNGRKIFIDNNPYTDLIIQELECIKKRPFDGEGKIRIISKDEMKILIGRSPDFADMIMMRMLFELQPKHKGSVSSY